MEANEAKALLADAAGDEDPGFLPPSVLPKLTADDVPDETFVEVGVPKDGVMRVEWSGRLYREAREQGFKDVRTNDSAKFRRSNCDEGTYCLFAPGNPTFPAERTGVHRRGVVRRIPFEAPRSALTRLAARA